MEMENFDVFDVQEVISLSGCEDMATITVKEEMYSQESSEVNACTPDNSINTLLINGNETIPYPSKEKGQESVNDSGTPFFFVGIKMEKPDDYQCESSCANLETKYSSEEYPSNDVRECNVDDQCLEGNLSSKLSYTSCIEIKMECEEGIDTCKLDFQTNDTPETIDMNSKFDLGHSSDEFIRGIECQEYPILSVKDEEEKEKTGTQFAVCKNNSVKMEEQEKPDDLYCCAAADLEYNIEEYPYSSDDDNKKGIVEEDNNFSTETKSIKAESEEEEVDVCELNCQSTENIFITKTFESQCGSHIYSIEMEVSCHELPRLIKAKVVSTPKSELCFRSIPE